MTGKAESYINTYTGRKFRMPDPDPAMVCLEDIAHALSMICRFNGHCNAFYSVAQHCINIYEMLRDQGYSTSLQLYGLLHDASEAYICDIPGPVKALIPGYKEIERGIQEVIWRAFKLPPPSIAEYRIMKEFDCAMLMHEMKKYMNSKSISAAETSPADIEKMFLHIGEKLLQAAAEGTKPQLFKEQVL